MIETKLFPIFVRQGRSRTRYKVGYIDQPGHVVIDPIFEEGTRFYEGLASVQGANSLWSDQYQRRSCHPTKIVGLVPFSRRDRQHFCERHLGNY